MSFTLHGLGVSSGIAIGRAMLMSHATLEVSHLTITPRMVDKEIARFDAAVSAVKSELKTAVRHVKDAVAEGNGKDAYAFACEACRLTEKRHKTQLRQTKTALRLANRRKMW